ncbi:MAG: outer membrane beta-barrel protein [Candidatus Cryptobacteroides sp.]
MKQNMNNSWTDKLREKMAGYTETPSDEVWEKVSARAGIPQGGESRRLVPVWFIPAVGMAAAAAGILLMLRHDPEMAEINPSAGMTAEALVQKEPELTEQKELSGQTETGTVSVNRIQDSGRLIADAGSGISGHGSKAEEPVQSIQHEDKEPAVYVFEEEDKEENCEEVIDHEAEMRKWAEIMSEDDSPRKARGHAGIGLSASGAGGSSMIENRSTNLVLGANPMASGTEVSAWVSPEILQNQGALTFNSPEVKTEYNHRIPVKLGLNARYGFGRFGVEAGVAYSILSSDLKAGEEGTSWSKGTQTLHYIGIPVNLSFNIFDSRYFTLYVSGGGMGELCAKGRVKKDEYENGAYARSTNSAIRPKEIQWSVNAAAGFQVNILKQLGFYVEPGVSHRFDNGSKVRSIYTDKPTDFSLGFGLRYNFL